MENRTEKLKRGLAAFEIELEGRTLQQLLSFLEEVLRWNRQINLTAVRTLDEGVERHLVDSLVLLPFCSTGPLLDVGSGAGFPAIPLALAKPELHIVSVEAVAKKINFQKHIRRRFEIKNLEPIHCRVEKLSQEKLYPIITARAFASVSLILALVAPLLELKGRFILLRGREDESILAETQTALEVHKMRIVDQKNYRLPFSGAERQILQIIRN